MIETSRFVAGGYFLARRATRGADYIDSPLLPPTIVSLSGCLADFAFEYWWNEENVAAAAGFGLSEGRFADLIAWYRDRFGHELGAPNVAFSTRVIDDFVAEFVDDASDLVIVGCGLSVEHRSLLVERHRAAADVGEYGVIEMLDQQLALETGGQPIGFEPISYEYGLECSWLCNGLEQASTLR